MNVLELFKNITTFVFDVDGVLTDGTVLVLDNGLQARRMHIRDGLALQMAIRNGYRVVIVSGGDAAPVKQRLEKLGVTEVYMQVTDKKKLIAEYMQAHQLPAAEVLFMGDDLPDLPAMLVAGLRCCPADAAHEIKEISQYISPVKGGEGCARDVIEKTLSLNDRWHYREDVSAR